MCILNHKNDEETESGNLERDESDTPCHHWVIHNNLTLEIQSFINFPRSTYRRVHEGDVNEIIMSMLRSS